MASPSTIATRKRFHALARGVPLGCERDGSGLELHEPLFQPLNLRRERGGALHQGRVRRARVGGTAAQLLGRFTGFEQPPLGHGQALVGGALVVLQPRNGGARLDLPPFEAVALLLGLPAFERQLLALLRQPLALRDPALQLRVESDDDLLQLVVFGVEGRDGTGGSGNGRLEAGGFLGQVAQALRIRRR